MPSIYSYTKGPIKPVGRPTLLSEDSDPEVHNVINQQIRQKRRRLCFKVILALWITMIVMTGIVALTYYFGGFTRTIRIIHTDEGKSTQLQSEFNPEALGAAYFSPEEVQFQHEDISGEVVSQADLETTTRPTIMSKVGTPQYKHCYDNVYMWCGENDANCQCPGEVTTDAGVTWLQSSSSDISLNLNRYDTDVDQLNRDLDSIFSASGQRQNAAGWAGLAVSQLCVALCSPDFTPVQVPCDQLMTACDQDQK